MNDLPVELFDKIISKLACSDLCSIRLTCKDFSDRAAPLLFEILHLSARPRLLNHPIVGPLSLTHPHWVDRVGRSRATSYCDLEEVSKIVQPTVAPLVKTLIFSPAWFREDLWYDYDNLQDLNTLHAPGQGRRPRSAQYESKKQKRERDTLVLPQAKRRWRQLIVKQNDSCEAIRAAVTAMIASMTRLENIMLTDRTQPSEFMGIDLTPEELYDGRRKQQQSNTWRFFSVLAHGLHAIARNIKTLAMYNLNACDLGACKVTDHAFTGLTKLSLSISDNEVLLQDSLKQQAKSLTSLLEYTALTLQYLSLDFSWENHRDYTKHSPSFGPILSRSIPDSSTGTPLIFPQLTEVRLRMLSIDTVALTKFLLHQPVLRKAFFDAMLLSTPNTTWNDVASALPCSVEGWQVRNVSQPKPNRPDQCWTWNPLVETLKPETGWELHVDRLSHLKSRRRFGTTKFARIN